MTVIKATRANILLGNTEIEVYQLPNGDYKWSLNQASEVVGFGRNWLTNALKREGETLTSLTAYGFSNALTPIKADRGEMKGISTEDFMALLTYAAFDVGNEGAKKLAAACLAESLERRADAAFGVIVSEQEREARLAARLVVKKEFHPVLTASMKAHMDIAPNQWGLYIKEFNDHIGLQTGERDSLSSTELVRLQGRQFAVASLLEAGMCWSQIMMTLKSIRD